MRGRRHSATRSEAACLSASCEAFHRQIEHAVDANRLRCVGTPSLRYPTRDRHRSAHDAAAIRRTSSVELLRPANGTDESGDGTVPRVAATHRTGRGRRRLPRLKRPLRTPTRSSRMQGVLTRPRIRQRESRRGTDHLSPDIDGVFASGSPSSLPCVRARPRWRSTSRSNRRTARHPARP